jgi:hypothetical protein
MCSPRLPRLWTLVDLLRDLGSDLPTIPMPRVRTHWAATAIALSRLRIEASPLPTRQRPPARFMDRARTVRQLTDPHRAA